jgi:hypothetical protein
MAAERRTLRNGGALLTHLQYRTKVFDMYFIRKVGIVPFMLNDSLYRVATVIAALGHDCVNAPASFDSVV